MTGNLPAAGTTFLIAPKARATTTARELHEMLAEQFPGDRARHHRHAARLRRTAPQ